MEKLKKSYNVSTVLFFVSTIEFFGIPILTIKQTDRQTNQCIFKRCFCLKKNKSKEKNVLTESTFESTTVVLSDYICL